MAALDLVEINLLDQLAAMRVYLDQLDRLTPLLDAMKSVGRIGRVADPINELVGQAVNDQTVVGRLTTLRHELDELAGSIQAMLQWLGGVRPTTAWVTA